MKTGLKRVINFCQGLWLLFKFKQVQLEVIRKSEIVFFFPYYHTGGAERVHLNIVQALKNKRSCVIFTHGSATYNFLSDFKKSAQVIELNSILNKRNTFVSKKLQKCIVKSINTKSVVKNVFASNTNYFYELLPLINQNIKKIDLIHALAQDDERSIVLAKSSKYINHRVLINKRGKKDLLEVYKKYNINSKYFDNLQVVSNGVKIPDVKLLEIFNKRYDKIRVGFVGRWSSEKRPEIYLGVAKRVSEKYTEVEFVMAGTGMKSNIKKIQESHVSFLGEFTDFNALNDLYKSINILIICSEYEGFPMVIMESMPFGVIPICTNVGGINEHILNNENGVLIEDTVTDKLIDAFFNEIRKLIENKQMLPLLSKKASSYAISHFDISSFNNTYKKLLD